MKAFINKLRENIKLKKALFATTFSLLFLVFVFSFCFDKIFPLNYFNIALFALFCSLTLLCCFLYKFIFKVDIYVFVLCALFLLMLISYAYNGFSYFPRTPILMILFSLFIYLWIQNRREKIDTYLFSFVVATWIFIIAFAFIERNHLLHIDFSYRAGSFFGNVNDVARHLVFAFILNIFFACKTKNKILRVFSIVALPVILFFTLLTGSISNLLLTILISIFAIVYISPKKYKPFTILLILFLIGLLILLVFVVPKFGPIKTRIMAIFSSLFNVNLKDVNPDGSARSRLSVAIYGFRLFLESPLFGSGYSSVYRNYYVMAHNNIVEIAADYGLFALICEEVKILYPLFNYKQVNKDKRMLVLMLCLYLFGIQFFLVSFNSKIEAFLIPFIFLLLENKLDYSAVSSLVKTNKSKENTNAKFKLVEIIPRLTPVGGAEKMVADICVDIVKRRPDIDLLLVRLYDENNFMTQTLIDAGVKTVSVGKKKGIDYRAAKKLYNVVKEFDPDVIHSHLVSLVTIFLSGLHNDYQIFHTIHTTPNKRSMGFKFSPYNLFMRYLFKSSIVPVAISESVKKEISVYFGKSLNEIPVVVNGINIAQYSNANKLSKRNIDFLYAGRFIEGKNILLIIKAFEKFNLEENKTNLYLAGSGKCFEECFNYVATNNIKNVKFLGFRNDIPSLLSDTKFLVMASSVEGNPIIINEAVASGTFVLSSDVGGISDIVNDTCGLLYLPIDVETLSKKMKWCYENIESIENKLEDNYLDNVSNISITSTVDNYLSLFQNSVNK